MLLRDYLKMKGIKNVDFALATGTHPSALTNAMSGKRVVSYEIVRAAYMFSEGAVGVMDWPEPPKVVPGWLKKARKERAARSC